MKTRFLFLVVSLSIMIFTASCKKDKAEPQTKLSEDQLENIVDASTTITSEVQSFMNNSLSVAIDSGYNTSNPPSVSNSKIQNFRLKSVEEIKDYTWSGPDANGWYSRYYSSYGYTYTEKVRYRDTIDYVMSYGYSGAEGSYSNVTTTQYIKYTKNEKVLYKGFSNWEVKASGYSDISAVQWKIVFKDWNPQTSAGEYDWYWGVSENLGGNTVPLHKYEHITATDIEDNWLHIHLIWYDDSGSEVWDFEYDTPWAPVAMPELPAIN